MPRQPEITKVCRLLRNEILPLFYKDNTFHGCNWKKPSVKGWVRAIGQANRQLVENFIVTTERHQDDFEHEWATNGGFRRRLESIKTVSGTELDLLARLL